MTAIEDTVERIVAAETWNQRVQEIRRVPEHHGQADHQSVYAEVADRLYKPHLSANFAFVPRQEDYELAHFAEVYRAVDASTNHFTNVSPPHLASVIQNDPRSLLVFRTIIGYTPRELAVATRELVFRIGGRGIGEALLKSLEKGGRISPEKAELLAETIDALISKRLWGQAPDGLRSKMDKSDTREGWASVQRFAAQGVPYSAFLHQRHMGGSFRQLLDAASEKRGALLELAVEGLLQKHGILHLRTGHADQGEIARRFNLTVHPAPDFVVFDQHEVLQALLECKLANDGGTARDKAARFANLRREGRRLGGVPVFALLDGLGWERVNDALGPVVRDCDGRVFTLGNLSDLLEVQPFPSLVIDHDG